MASPRNQHCADCIGTLSFPHTNRLNPENSRGIGNVPLASQCGPTITQALSLTPLGHVLQLIAALSSFVTGSGVILSKGFNMHVKLN